MATQFRCYLNTTDELLDYFHFQKTESNYYRSDKTTITRMQYTQACLAHGQTHFCRPLPKEADLRPYSHLLFPPETSTWYLVEQTIYYFGL